MKYLFFIFSTLISSNLLAQANIASCYDPKGYAFYPFISPVPKNKSGWTSDSINGGRVTVVKKGNEFDVLFTDTSKRVISSIQDGGTVVPLRVGTQDFALLIAYDNVAEIYTFWKADDGSLQYSLIQSKGSRNPIHKTAAYAGKCDFINFNLIK